MKNTAVRARLLGSQDADGALVFLCYPLDVVDQAGLPRNAGRMVAVFGDINYTYIYTHVAISVCWFYFLLDAWNPQRSGFHQKLKVQEEAIPGNQKQCAV